MVAITKLDEAKRFMVDCYEAVGTCRAYAEIAAENLLVADYRGHFSHGMNRLSWYINDICNKVLDPNATPQIEKETVATALVNGNNGLGAVIGKFAMDLAVQKAKAVGIGMVTTYQSNHFGAAGVYTLQALEQGCIGMCVTNTSPIMVPTRAKQAALGSNALSFAAPGLNNDNLVVDMATSTVSMGKLEIQKRKGEQLPQSWALNEKGEVETDPDKAIKARRFLPVGGDEISGGYKGYGLAMMIEVLSGILSGSNYGPNIPMWNNGRAFSANLGQAFIAIDPAAFQSGYESRLSDLMGYIRQMEPKDPNKPVLIPGDPEVDHMKLVDSQGGLCYVKDQHDSNDVLADQLKVKRIKYVVKE